MVFKNGFMFPKQKYNEIFMTIKKQKNIVFLKNIFKLFLIFNLLYENCFKKIII